MLALMIIIIASFSLNNAGKYKIKICMNNGFYLEKLLVSLLLLIINYDSQQRFRYKFVNKMCGFELPALCHFNINVDKLYSKVTIIILKKFILQLYLSRYKRRSLILLKSNNP